MRKLLLFLCVILVQNAIAQPRCGFDEMHRTLLQKDTSYSKFVQEMNSRWVQTVSNSNALTVSIGSNKVYEIPVVVHVMHTGGAIGSIYNPTDSAIISMIDYLNEVYAAKYASYPDTNNGGVFFPVKFVLAKRSPSCGSTTGINRINASSITGYTSGGVLYSSTGASQTAVKALSVWPHNEYYNIWIVNKIDGADGTSGTFTAGYAYFPGAGADLDGTVMLATQVKSGAETLPHEIGHAFSLYHTFEGDGTGSTCPPNTNCAGTGDLVCDTDPHKRSPFNCPSGTNPCTGSPYGTVVHNIMDYSNCKDRFTPGQKARWINGLLNARPGLATSVGAVAPPASSITAANCVTTVTNTGNNFEMGPHLVTFADMSANSRGYSLEGAGYIPYVDKTCAYTANVVAGSQYSISVLTRYNAQNVAVFIDYNNNGIFGSGELVYSHTGTISGDETHSSTITIPSSGVTTCTRLRMRVIADFNSIPSTGCGTLGYGQAEDFSVYIRPANTVLTATNTITTGSNPSCTGSQLVFTVTPGSTPTSPTYTWYVNDTVVQSGSGTTYTTSGILNNSIVYCKMKYTGSCGADSTYTNVITVQRVTSAVPTVSIVANPGNNICAGTSVTFTATPTNGGSSPSYQWRVNGNAAGSNSNTFISSTLTNGQQVTCTLTSSATCATPTTANSNAITMTVTPTVTPSVSIAANPGTTICAGTLVTFTATPTNGGSSPSYQWRVNGSAVGTNSSTYSSSSLTNGQQVTCTLTSNASCRTSNTANSNSLAMTVNPVLTPSVSISANTGSSICAGTSVTFTATPTNGGTSPTYQWRVNGNPAGTNSNTFTTSSLTNGQQVTCTLTSNAPCVTSSTANSNTITMTVTPTVTPSVSISANTGNSICAGTSVTFTATPTNGGASPTYQWKVNGINAGTNSNTFTTSSLANGQQVTCSLTSNATCPSPATVASNTITMTVSSTIVPSVAISASPGTTNCAGQTVTFTATPTNGGTSPSYQWKLNGFNVGTNSNTYINSSISNNDQVTCVMTSNLGCASPTTGTSNTLTMSIVASLAPSVSISASPGSSVCTGTSVTFTATPVNAGSNPSYQWKVGSANVGTNSPTYTTSSLTNGQQVSCVITSSATCASPLTGTSNTITMAIAAPSTPSVSISANPGNNICAGTSVTFTATPTNGGPAPTYQWKVNGNNVGTNSNTYTSTTLSNGSSVTCTMVSNGACVSTTPVTSNSITMLVSPVLTPSVVIASSAGTSICAGSNVIFTATPSNGGSSPSFQWKVNGNNVGTNSSSYSTSSLTNGQQVSCVLTSSVTCVSSSTATSNIIPMTVNPVVNPTINITSNIGNVSCIGGQVVFTANITNGGTAPIYQWKVNGVNAGTNSNKFTATAGNNVITCVLTSNAICPVPATLTSNSINMSVNSPSVSVSASPGNVICSGTIVDFSAQGTAVGNNPQYQWTKNGQDIPGLFGQTVKIPGLVTGDNINCKFIGSDNCKNGPQVTGTGIAMTVNTTMIPLVTIKSDADSGAFEGELITFQSNSNVSAVNYQWFVNGSPVNGATLSVFSSSNLKDGDSVHVELQATDSCIKPASAISNDIVVNIAVGVKRVETLFSEIRLMPNPNSGDFTVRGRLADGIETKDAYIEVLNGLGALIHKEPLVISSQSFDKKIQLGNEIANGLYMVRLNIGGQNQVMRFVVQK